MLTRNDRTIEDAGEPRRCRVRPRRARTSASRTSACRRPRCGSSSPGSARRGGVCLPGSCEYNTRGGRRARCEAARALGVDRILGGTDLDAARRMLGDLSRYFPVSRPPGRPSDAARRHGGAGRRALRARRARMGCGGVDLLAYRATEADPLDLVRAARDALPARRLIVAGSVHSAQQIHALAAAGVDAFTIGSAVFDGAFSPAKGSLRGQILDILEACDKAPRWRRERRIARFAQCRGAGRRLAQLLRGEYPTRRRRADRRPHRRDRHRAQLRGTRGGLVAALGLGRRLAVVSDPATHEVLGARVERALAGPRERRLVRARRAAARRRGDRRSACAPQLRAADALVAVGSGTINDLCKYAAAQDGKPYAVFATAPSMNGYTSMNAAITVDGHKKSLPAVAARGVFIDLEVLAARAAADDPRRARRFAVPPDGAGRLAAVASCCSARRTAQRAVRAAGGRRAGCCSTRPRRCCAAISTRCARWRARWCCPASA